ncbi:MAG: helix-turn-helix domain-containing protein [Clostridium sp.]|jgi:DNA-binding transcriptional regulator YiaG|nr:helix-turn-helix domain-containing protein [Clostridium sp.]
MLTISEALKVIRQELNISQETLARDLNVSYGTLNRWENNKVKPSRLAMDKIKAYCAENGITSEIREELEKYR